MPGGANHSAGTAARSVSVRSDSGVHAAIASTPVSNVTRGMSISAPCTASLSSTLPAPSSMSAASTARGLLPFTDLPPAPHQWPYCSAGRPWSAQWLPRWRIWVVEKLPGFHHIEHRIDELLPTRLQGQVDFRREPQYR